MIIKDRIYGIYQITSPVILELINSKPVQRLKKISQMGPPEKYYHLIGYSRYEHSVGVMLLLKHLGASKEEQIVGLLHDVSHTTFSHLIDWVVGTGHTEEFQDNQHAKYLLNSEIKDILVKYNYNPKRICNNKKFSLLDNDIPNLCADRFDYAAREFPQPVAEKCFRGLTTFNKKIVFINKNLALLFATNFLKRQIKHWGGFEAGSRYILLSECLQLALKNKLISFGDFMKDEDSVIKKLESSTNKKIKLFLSILKYKDLSFLPKTKKLFHKKFRFVDPEFIEKNRLRKLTEVNKNFENKLKTARKDNDKGIQIVKVIFN